MNIDAVNFDEWWDRREALDELCTAELEGALSETYTKIKEMVEWMELAEVWWGQRCDDCGNRFRTREQHAPCQCGSKSVQNCHGEWYC